MPFYYDVQVPDIGKTGAARKYVFVRWIVSQKANVETGTALAMVRDGATRYILRNAGPGFFTPWNIRDGEEVSPGQAIGRIVTDGDLIPYGRHYVTFEAVPAEQP